jgi:2-furoyl-CoA dehydrogenase large subunit
VSESTATLDQQPSWLGQSVRRKEDGRFLTGRATYTDDIVLPGMLHAAMLRCPYAHALIRGIDYSRALDMPGVYGVITGEDVARVTEPEKGRTYPRGGSWYYIATDRARFAGEIVAIVAAEDRYLAEDALDAIVVDYEPLPVVVDPERAADPDQPELHPGAPGGNLVMEQVWDFGDVDAAFAAADVVVQERLEFHRHSATPLEGLVAISSYEPTTGETTIWANIGNLGRYSAASRALRCDISDVRLIVPDVGGSFGIKAWVHQRAVLMAVLSRKVGRPVKWTEDRLEHLRASHHGTGRIALVEMAARRDGTILGLKLDFLDDQGAYICLTEPHGPELLIRNGVTSCYRFRAARLAARAVVTNKCPVASNRGYGRIQPMFLIERIIDRVARALDLDPAEVRERNLIQPSEYPYHSPSHAVYDSGDPPALLAKTRELLDYGSARREQARARQDGRWLGLGLAMAVELGGPVPVDVATVQLTPDGRLNVQAPTLAQGQGHETTIAQIVGARFNTDPSQVHVTVQFDSATMPYTASSGTYASRFSSTGAPAVDGAACKLADQLARLAAKVLEANAADVEFYEGTARVRGVPERNITLRQLGTRAHFTPEIFGDLADVGLQATYHWQWPNLNADDRGQRGAATFTLLCHGALVEVDADTGAIRILKYVATEDCGRLINPMIVRGQAMGGIVNGLGWALTEDFVNDDAGQLLTGTFMDYLLPRFTDIPPLDLAHIECPTPFTALGAKGMGEGGSIPPPACIANAVEDAIWHAGGRIVDSHLTPETVLRALRGGAGRSA